MFPLNSRGLSSSLSHSESRYSHNAYASAISQLNQEISDLSSRLEEKIGNQRENLLEQMQEQFSSISEENKSLKENVQVLETLCHEGQECLKKQSLQITSLVHRVHSLEQQNRFRKKADQNTNEKIKEISAVFQRDLKEVRNTLKSKELSFVKRIASLQNSLVESGSSLAAYFNEESFPHNTANVPLNSQNSSSKPSENKRDLKDVQNLSTTNRKSDIPAAKPSKKGPNAQNSSAKRRLDKEKADDALLDHLSRQYQNKAVLMINEAINNRKSGILIAECFTEGPNQGKSTGKSFEECCVSAKEALENSDFSGYLQRLEAQNKILVLVDRRANKSVFLQPFAADYRF